MTEVSWRRDCNVILAPFASQNSFGAADAVTAWHLACTLANNIRVLPLAGLTTAALPLPRIKNSWRLHARQWDNRKADAARAHGHHIHNPGYEIYGRLA
jgi:hypothetical protein